MITISFKHLNRILIYLLICLTFPAHLIYCQTDTLENKGQTTKENNYNYGRERFSLSMGSFIAGNNAGITMGSQQAGLGIVIDLEDALGLETSSFVFRGNANFRFGSRRQHAIVIDYFSMNRRATKILEKDLEIGNQIYPVGTQLDSKLYLSIIRSKYEYTFLQDNRVYLGASAGLFIMPLNFAVKSGNSEEQSTKMIAPLPVFGLRSEFFITKKLVLKQSAELLYLKIDNFTGGILDLNIALEHKTFKHFGFGLGINSNKLNISAKGSDYPNIDFFGEIKMEYTGVFLYASYYF